VWHDLADFERNSLVNVSNRELAHHLDKKCHQSFKTISTSNQVTKEEEKTWELFLAPSVLFILNLRMLN